MATRKELLKAYGFTSQRLIKALVDRNPEDTNAPLRRVALGSFASVMVGVLIFAALGVVGWLNPAKTSKWQVDKTVVVDKTSGGVFVYLENVLYPTYNITSAKLATAGGPTVAVTTKSLRTAPKTSTTTIGIPGAPNQLPDATSSMAGYPVRLCASAPTAGRRSTTLQIGDPSVPAPTSNPAVLVADAQGVQFLVINGIAHRAPTIKGQSIALALGFQEAVTPGPAFLSGLAKGVTLDPPPIPGLGGDSRKPVAGATTIGTVLRYDGGPDVGWFVLLADGVAPISAVEATALQLQLGTKPVAAQLADLTGKASSSTVRSAELASTGTIKPTSIDPDAALCSTWSDAGPQITVDPTDVPETTARASSPTQADQVIMPPMTGALVRPDTVVDPAGGMSLITNGMRYGLADTAARDALGYAKTTVRPLPEGLIELIPQGLAAGQILSIPRAQPGGGQ